MAAKKTSVTKSLGTMKDALEARKAPTPDQKTRDPRGSEDPTQPAPEKTKKAPARGRKPEAPTRLVADAKNPSPPVDNPELSEPSPELVLGAPAPKFSAPDQDGKLVSLDGFAGKKVVLYFYPKDDTTGCTKEACDFRDNEAHFASRNAVIVGVSPDPAKAHTKFRTKYSLPFTLLSDEDRAVAKAYGAWRQKSMYGRSYMGVERSTFLIDEQGKLLKIYRKVSVTGHAASLLSALDGV